MFLLGGSAERGRHHDNAFKIVLAQTLCAGDCNDDGRVGINELITGVNIALGWFLVGDCRAFDRNDDNSVSISELVQAVNRALHVGFWDPLPSVTAIVTLDSEDRIMLRSEQTPETPVWFTQDDVAADRDTVVEAALAWIAEENGD